MKLEKAKRLKQLEQESVACKPTTGHQGDHRGKLASHDSKLAAVKELRTEWKTAGKTEAIFNQPVLS